MSTAPSPEKLFKERHQSKKNCIFINQHHRWYFLQHFLYTFPKSRVDKVTSQAKVLRGHIVISLATEAKDLSISQPPWGTIVPEVRNWPRIWQFGQGLLLGCLIPSTSALLCKSLYNHSSRVMIQQVKLMDDECDTQSEVVAQVKCWSRSNLLRAVQMLDRRQTFPAIFWEH